MLQTPLSDVAVARPDPASLAEAHTARLAALPDATDLVALVTAWDDDQRRWYTQKQLAGIRFCQDTRDPLAKADKEYFDQHDPDITAQRVEFLRALLASPRLAELEGAFGGHALALFAQSLTTFEPAIANDLRAEKALANAYDERMAALRIEVDGSSYNLSQLAGLYGHADRGVRHRARIGQDAALAGLQGALDELFDQQVAIRTRMARTLGHASYTPLGYARLRRTDYGPEQVAVFRESIRTAVVPLVGAIRARHAETLGLDDYAYHDESVSDPRGVPRPEGDHDWMLGRAEALFAELGPDFRDFFVLMRDRGLLDLKAREGKLGGGFCEALPSLEVPFIFANFNGSQDDVEVFTHEVGHAFQWYQARGAKLLDLQWPTLEACEIHSMGLELLTHPQMERFFGQDAERFRRGHLESALLFLPYGALVDHFQHEVYEHPDWSPDDRAACWTALEARYLPTRVYADTPYFAGGRLWQRQGHLFHEPFYYIDYCLAQACALQLWARARTDRAGTLALYRKLCKLGGSKAFTALLHEVGLDNPFEAGSLERTLAPVREALDL